MSYQAATLQSIGDTMDFGDKEPPLEFLLKVSSLPSSAQIIGDLTPGVENAGIRCYPAALKTEPVPMY